MISTSIEDLCAEYLGLQQTLSIMQDRMKEIEQRLLDTEGREMLYKGTRAHGDFVTIYAQRTVGGWDKKEIERLLTNPRLTEFKRLVTAHYTFTDEKFLMLPPIEQAAVMKARSGRHAAPSVRIETATSKKKRGKKK